jgi:hypothetical protein
LRPKGADRPALYAGMSRGVSLPFADEEELRAELQAYPTEASQSDCSVRVSERSMERSRGGPDKTNRSTGYAR